MILAAGRGERMRPLTDHRPKPLLDVGGKPLIAWHIEGLARAGLRDIVINNAWLGEQIVQALGDGSRWGVRLTHSSEPRALETAGGIAQALPWLGPEPFLVINGDLWCDWDLARAHTLGERLLALDALCACVMIDNPAHHPQGDFHLEGGRLTAPAGLTPRLTFSGIGVYHPALFRAVPPGAAAALAPVLREAMALGRALGERHDGVWQDIGTVARLEALQAQLQRAP
jgi:MurNAc alpha-1-phosphate uridylyltransferase